MRRVRVTVKHNPDDPTDDLRCAARVRRDLWSHSPVEIDPDSPRHGTHRDDQKNAFFEFATDRIEEVQRVLHEYGYEGRAQATVVQDANGTECVNCGSITPELVTVCPICQFRDVAACPHCKREIPRLEYTPLSGDLFKCPTCHKRVRLQFQDLQLEAGDVVEVNLNHPANVQLLDPTNFEQYSNGKPYRYLGGYAKETPVRIAVPDSGRWHVVVDLGGGAGTVSASLRVLSGAPTS